MISERKVYQDSGAVPKLTPKRWHQIVTEWYFERSTPSGMS